MVLCGSKYKYNVPLHVFVLPYSYEFKVKPKNELGEGPPSEPVTFNTESGNAFLLYCFLVESLLRTIHTYKMFFFFFKKPSWSPKSKSCTLFKVYGKCYFSSLNVCIFIKMV